MLTFLLGPFLALLPRRWRDTLSFREVIGWRKASILSGFGEAVFALVALVYWYSYSVTTWVSRGVDSAHAGKMGQGVTDQELGLLAIMVFALHPLTWLIAYAGMEGSVRLWGAAFAGNNLGILPLFVLDEIILKITGRGAPGAAQSAGFSEGNFSSYVGAIRERIKSSHTPVLPDELCVTREASEVYLEIRSSHRKLHWTPPRTVRYQDAFYRLESFHDGTSPRPFRYWLRRLPTGVMGRSVLVYSPEEPPALAEK